MSVVVEWRMIGEESTTKRLLDQSPVSIGGGAGVDVRIPGLPDLAASLTFDEDEVWLSPSAAPVAVEVDGRPVDEGGRVLIRASTQVEIDHRVSLSVRRRNLASIMQERFGPSSPVIKAPLVDRSGPLPAPGQDGRPTRPPSPDTDPPVPVAGTRQAGLNDGNAAGRRRPTATTKGDRPATPAAHLGTIGVGTTLGERYELRKRIGTGGMATVFEANDLRFTGGQPVAVKILGDALAANEESRARFKREADVASRLRSHDNIVKVFDYGVEPVPYIVMELLKGQDLGRRLVEGTISKEDALGVLLAVCAGVHAAHENGVTHRDLKPQNVFVTETPAGRRVKLLDFGISVATTIRSLTKPGLIVGTWEYISPEQARGEAADTRSDQYAIGVMLYEVLTGRLPFEGINPMALFASITEGRCPTPRAIDPTIAPELEEIALRAMARDSDQRFASVHDLGAALLPHVNEEDRAEWTRYFTTKNPNQEYSVPVRRQPSASVPKAAGGKGRRREARRPSRIPSTATRDRRLIVGMVVTAVMALAAIVTVKGLAGRSTVPGMIPSVETAASRTP